GRNSYRGGYWSQAAAAHLGIGGLIEEGGGNVHVDDGPMAFAKDVSVALFLGHGANNRYTAVQFGFSTMRSPLALFVDEGGSNLFQCAGNKAPDWARGSSPGFARYYAGFEGGPDGTSHIEGEGAEALPYFSYLHSYGLFLDVGEHNTYVNCGAAQRGGVWGDGRGSDNGRIHNIGFGMDVPTGSIDWRPLPVWADTVQSETTR